MATANSPRRQALRIALLYVCVAALWILLSGRLVNVLFSSADARAAAELWKGLFYVVLTGAGLYALLHGYLRRNLYRAEEREQALQISVGHYRLLFDNSPVPMWAYNPENLRFLAVNAAALDLYGYSRDEWMALTLLDLRDPDEHPRLLERVRDLPPGRLNSGIWRHRDKRGRPLFLSIVSDGVILDGQPARLVQAQDITAQEEMQSRLEESERLYAGLLANLPGMVYRCRNDPDWTMEFINAACLPILGRQPEALIGNRDVSYGQLIHPDDRERVWEAVQQGVKQRTGFVVSYRMHAADGRLIWVWEQGQGIFDSAGDLLALEGYVSDITAQKQAEAALDESETRWAFAIESNNDAVWDWDIPSGKVFFSERWGALLGYSNGDLGNDFAEMSSRLHPDDVGPAFAALQSHFRGESEYYRIEHRLRHKNGSYIWVLDRGKVIERLDGGQPKRMIGTHTDITTHKEAEQSLRLAATVFEYSNEGQFVTDSALRIVSLNQAFCDTTGFSRDEALGRTPDLLVGSETWNTFLDDALTNLAEHGHWEGEGVGVRKNGESYTLWLSISQVPGVDGNISYYCGFIDDLSERERAAERIDYLIHHDSLTHLPNRALLFDRLTQMVAQASRDEEKVAVLVIDLDHFKSINDSLGPATGDRLLQDVANRLEAELREGDTLARQGGDEFLVLLPNAVDANRAARVAEKLVAALRPPMALGEQEVNITGSIGISLYPDDGHDPESLVKNADAALYHAKTEGRNSYRFYAPDMNARALEQLSLESGMRRGLERREFLLHFQPQVDAATGRPLGAEALVRWQHPERGLVPPLLFIPLAEERGFIIELGEWILREACRQAVAWQSLGIPALPVAVNLSALQFRDRTLPWKIRDILEETGLAPELLELEITESALMNADAAATMLRELRDMGLRLSIDDFGTGYSSLNYLRRFPLTRLKVDQTFVRDLQTGHDAGAIVRTIVDLARNLQLGVIAEGVETPVQGDWLRAAGVDELQGYFFSKPLPPDDFIAWVNRQSK